MLDRYFPGVLKPKIENDLRRDAVDSAVGEPLEKARDKTVVTSFSFHKKRQS